MFVRLFLLFYADDTILMSESPEGLQSALDVFDNYCSEWKLKVNTSKTSIFAKRKITNKCFKLGGDTLEIVNFYSYLGLVMN